MVAGPSKILGKREKTFQVEIDGVLEVINSDHILKSAPESIEEPVCPSVQELHRHKGKEQRSYYLRHTPELSSVSLKQRSTDR